MIRRYGGIFMKCDFGILLQQDVKEAFKFHKNWHSERHTFIQSINEFVPFSTFLFNWSKIWNSKIIE